MSSAVGISFLILEVVFITLALLMILQMGVQRLESSIGIMRDGFPPGKAAPKWSLPDLMGQMRKTPTGSQWQLLIFVDHTLVSFPELSTEINQFSMATPELEVLVVSRDDMRLCVATQEILNLQVPIVPVDQSFYERYRVRIMPFVMFLDPLGTVYSAGLVNNVAQLFNTWKMVQATAHDEDISEEVIG